MIDSRKIFLFGAGGMGMSPLACYLVESGFEVEAYDDFFTEPTHSNLQQSGVRILHEPIPINQPDLVIRSSAVSKDDPRLLPFRKSNLPIFRRGTFVSRFCTSKRVVAIAGSHGKTTTSGMLVWALKQVGFPFPIWLGEDSQKMFCHLVQLRINRPGSFWNWMRVMEQSANFLRK